MKIIEKNEELNDDKITDLDEKIYSDVEHDKSLHNVDSEIKILNLEKKQQNTKFITYIIKKKFKPQSGFEPETSCLQGKRSNQLSYNGKLFF